MLIIGCVWIVIFTFKQITYQILTKNYYIEQRAKLTSIKFYFLQTTMYV